MKSRPQIFFRPSAPWQVMRVMAWLRKLASAVPTCEAVMASFTPSSNRGYWTFCLQVQMAIKCLSFREAGTANLMSFFFFWNLVFFLLLQFPLILQNITFNCLVFWNLHTFIHPLYCVEIYLFSINIQIGDLLQ